MSEEEIKGRSEADAAAEENAPEAEAGDAQEGQGAAHEEAADPTPEEQVADLKDRLLRAVAETENIRRRADKEKQDALKFGITRFARDILSVSDNLRRAIEAVPADAPEAQTEVVKNLLTGVEMTERELLSCFEKHGIRTISPKGEKFDPNLHQAMAEVPGTGQPNGTIIDVYQTGYVIEERLLRPAMVTVAKDVSAPDPAEGASGEETGGDTDGGSASPGATVNTTV